MNLELHLTFIDKSSSSYTLMIRRHFHQREFNDENDELAFQNFSKERFKEMVSFL